MKENDVEMYLIEDITFSVSRKCASLKCYVLVVSDACSFNEKCERRNDVGLISLLNKLIVTGSLE